MNPFATLPYIALGGLGPNSDRRRLLATSGRILVAALASVSLIGGACSGQGARNQAERPFVSRIYDVPLHKSSVASTATSRSDREVYNVALPVEGLANFYTLVAKMGDGMPFRDLQWCLGSRTQTSPRQFERVWRSPSTSDFLVIRGMEDGEGAQLSIIKEGGNSTRTC